MAHSLSVPPWFCTHASAECSMGQPRHCVVCDRDMDRFSADANARNDDALDADDTGNAIDADAGVDAT